MSTLDVIRGRQVVAPLTNKSGTSRSEGVVVIRGTTADDSFTVTTVLNSKLVIGVVAETIANDAEGRVIIGGYVPVLAVDAATSRGDYLTSSDTAGKAKPNSNLVRGTFGIALSAVGAAGNVSALIWPLAPYSPVGEIILLAQHGMARTDSGCAASAQMELGAVNHVDAYAMAFDMNADEYGQWTALMPEDWDGGTVTARYVWTCVGGVGGLGETVNFAFSGRSYGDSDALDQAQGAKVAVTDTWLAALDTHISAASAAITLAGTPAAGEYVVFEIMRDISEDDLGGDALLLAVRISYTRAFEETT